MYGIFNIIFLPGYFKTAYRFGKPLIYGVIVTLIFGVSIELLALLNETARTFLENPATGYQVATLTIGIVLFIGFSYIALKISHVRYLKIQ